MDEATQGWFAVILFASIVLTIHILFHDEKDQDDKGDF